MTQTDAARLGEAIKQARIVEDGTLPLAVREDVHDAIDALERAQSGLGGSE